jgi:leader peptidase (prepilin peptidase)/N-methyltransferase
VPLVDSPGVVALWALLGVLGGGLAYRLADRLLEPSGEGRMGLLPRCPRCGRAQTPLHRIALLPLRCPGCGVAPDRQQALFEAACAVLILLLALRPVDVTTTAIDALATLVLVVATITDLRARLIFNALTYPATALALAAALLTGGGLGLLSAGLGALLAGGIGLLIWFLGRLLYRRGDVFGLGDVKLALFIGAVVGLPRAPTALMAGIGVGGLFGLLLVLSGSGRRATMPYGPALAIGAYLTLLLA